MIAKLKNQLLLLLQNGPFSDLFFRKSNLIETFRIYCTSTTIMGKCITNGVNFMEATNVTKGILFHFIVREGGFFALKFPDYPVSFFTTWISSFSSSSFRPSFPSHRYHHRLLSSSFSWEHRPHHRSLPLICACPFSFSSYPSLP